MLFFSKKEMIFRRVCLIKNNYLCTLEFNFEKYIKNISHEKNISTIEQKKKK
jgi:hypothetical protein